MNYLKNDPAHEAYVEKQKAWDKKFRMFQWVTIGILIIGFAAYFGPQLLAPKPIASGVPGVQYFLKSNKYTVDYSGKISQHSFATKPVDFDNNLLVDVGGSKAVLDLATDKLLFADLKAKLIIKKGDYYYPELADGNKYMYSLSGVPMLGGKQFKTAELQTKEIALVTVGETQTLMYIQSGQMVIPNNITSGKKLSTDPFIYSFQDAEGFAFYNAKVDKTFRLDKRTKSIEGLKDGKIQYITTGKTIRTVSAETGK